MSQTPGAWRLRTWLVLTTLPGLLLPPLVVAGIGQWGALAVSAMVAVQLALVAAALAWVARLRVDDPAARLASQLAALAQGGDVPALAWPPGEGLEPLARQIDELRDRQASLQAEAEAREVELRKLTMYDSLTGLPNRLLMRELFVHQSAVARRAGTSLALLLVNLDRFRHVNDTLGLAMGDEVLVRVSRCIAATLRESDFVCRLGGDEFMVLLAEPGGWDRVARAAERLLRAVEGVALPAGAGVPMSARVGITMYPSDGGDFEALARSAGLALARAKSQGRGQQAFFHPSLESALRSSADLEQDLLRALAAGELSLHYQGIVDASSGHVQGCEALLRWQHPVRGLLMAPDFLGAAEQAGVLRELTQFTLEEACTQAARWADAGLSIGRLAINLSARQAFDPALPDRLQAVLARCHLGAQAIELEISESSMTADAESATRALHRLRRLGVALSLDDFGTGSTSLAHLKALRPDRLKIDQGFVHGLPDDAEGSALVEAMFGMTQALGIEPVAEGVESAAQRDWLLSRGCLLQQGYLFGRPAPAELFEVWLAARPVVA